MMMEPRKNGRRPDAVRAKPDDVHLDPCEKVVRVNASRGAEPIGNGQGAGTKPG